MVRNFLFRWRWILKLVFALGVLVLLFSRFSFRDVIRIVISIELKYFIAAFSLNLLTNFVIACQWHICARHVGMGTRISGLYKIVLITRFYEIFLPGLGPVLVKWYKMFNAFGLKAHCLLSIFFLRFVNAIIALTLGIVFLLIDNPFNSQTLFVYVFLFYFVLIFLFIIFRYKYFFNLMISIFDCLNKYVPAGLKKQGVKFFKSIDTFFSTSKTILLKISLLSILIIFISVISHYLLSLSLNLELNFWVVAWLTVVVYMVRLLPLTIAGLGVREGIFIFCLNYYDVSPYKAMAFSLVVFAVIFLTALVGWVIEICEIVAKRSVIRKNNEDYI